MDLYGQDAELGLLSALVSRLDHRSAIDVGAEQGVLAAGLLDAGVQNLHAIDPHPANVNALRTRFADDQRVIVHEYAVSDGDGTGELHVSSNPDGTPVSFGHTLLERDDTHEISWTGTLPVTLRSLQSLLEAGEIPGSVGILKIDTEGHDLAVVRGMGALQADVVMVEHWTDLPNGLGKCPWSTREMLAPLRAQGFSHFAFIVHRGDFVTLQWDDGEVERGAMGNLVFLHERVLERLLPAVLECAGTLAGRAVHVGQNFMQAAYDRSALIDELNQAMDSRSGLVAQLREAVDDRSLRAHELEQLANERLARLQEAEQVAQDRLALLDEFKRVADERLALVDELERVANERLALVDELSAVAEARLEALEATTAQLNAQAAELKALRGHGLEKPA